MKLAPALVFFLLAHLLHAQNQTDVDFTSISMEITPFPKEKEIRGSGTYSFQIKKRTDSIFLDAHDMTFFDVGLDGKSIEFKNNGKKFGFKAPKKIGRHRLSLKYKATPKQTVYFFGWNDAIDGNEQIWTQGQGKYTSHWLPSFDDMTEKVEFDLHFRVDKSYQVISNGKLKRKEPRLDNENTWHFDMQKPMSSYLAAFVIGNFKKKTIQSASGVSIELYFEPKDSLRVESTYRYSKAIFDFLESEIGVPYPWQNYKQVPVQDFLYAGMENTGATIFSNAFMVDSTAFRDKNFVNVNAHEMAHQWFGNLVTEQSGEHHWLHEGFATYYAYLAEKELFGEDYFYWRLLETAWALNNFSGEGNGEALTDPSAGSLTFYEKGAWALVMLRERVGDAYFKEGIQNYLNKYAFKNVTIPDFMWEMEKASGMKLTDFEEMWLQESEFPFAKVKEFLINKSASIKTYFEIQDTINGQKELANHILRKKWNNLLSQHLKHQLILDYGTKLSPSFIQQILQNEGLKVRQGVALSLAKFPKEIQFEVESLLGDSSYKTIESALLRLWSDFPERQGQYLDSTSKIVGLPNKNVRLLWLTLALVTPEYQNESKPKYFKELSGYTSPEHNFEIRLLAFQYLKSIGGFNDETIKNLIMACSHHVWHFKKSCRKMLKEFLKEEGNKKRLQYIYPTLSLEQQKYIDKTLGK